MRKLALVLTFLGWPLIAFPPVLIYGGSAMNEIVIHHNGNYMPVICDDLKNVDDSDPVHQCIDKDTRLRWLSDVLIADDGEKSLGDEVIELGIGLRSTLLYVWIGLLGLVAYNWRHGARFWLGSWKVPEASIDKREGVEAALDHPEFPELEPGV